MKFLQTHKCRIFFIYIYIYIDDDQLRKNEKFLDEHCETAPKK